jgi:hypothetical protein
MQVSRVPEFTPSTGIYFMKKGAYVTDRYTPSVAAAASNSNCEPPKTSIDSPGPSTSTSKAETHPSSPEDVRPLPKAGPRKSQNVNKKRTTVILTDTSVKKYRKKLQRTSWSK